MYKMSLPQIKRDGQVDIIVFYKSLAFMQKSHIIEVEV